MIRRQTNHGNIAKIYLTVYYAEKGDTECCIISKKSMDIGTWKWRYFKSVEATTMK
ncbi:MAG: hypothetical protein ACLRH0_12460 [Blautia wexlerae]